MVGFWLAERYSGKRKPLPNMRGKEAANDGPPIQAVLIMNELIG